MFVAASMMNLSEEVKSFYDDFICVRKKYCINVRCANEAVACGQPKKFIFELADRNLLEMCDVDVTGIIGKSYPHVFIKGTKYDTCSAKTDNKFNNSVCEVQTVGLFCIQNIVVVKNVCILKCFKIRKTEAKNLSPNLYAYQGLSKKPYWINANKVTKQTFIVLRKKDTNIQFLFEVPNACEFE